MSQPTFSAVIVVRDEEAHMHQCLEPLTWCAERIVVDMESRDGTRALAASLATKVLAHPWVPHMEFARNAGIDAATGDWILVVDADEVIPHALVRSLRAYIAAHPEVAGVWLPRMNYCFGKPVPHVGGFPDYQLRCFRRGAGRYPDRLHSIPALDGPVAFLPIEDGAWMLHLRKNAAITDLVSKWDVYSGKEAATHHAGGAVFAGPVGMLWAALSAFRARFFVMRGYRDGMAGLVLSVVFAFYRFEIEAKLWETSGARSTWDAEVGRLSSVARLLRALVMHGVRRRARRARDGDSAP